MRLNELKMSVLLLALLNVTACTTGTPDCGSSEVKADLNELAEQRIANAINNEMQLAPSDREKVAAAVKDRLTYAFSAIRKTDHDESTDTYQCSSTLTANVEGAGRNWEHEFVYEVFSVEDENANYQLNYDPAGLGPVAYAALAVRNQPETFSAN